MSDGNRELPDGWNITFLDCLGRWRGGGTPSKAISEYWNNGTVPWVSPKDMKQHIITKTKDYITEKAVLNSSAQTIPKSSILIVTRSGILERILPVAINDIPVATNQDLKALILDEELSPSFIAFFLKSHDQAIRDECAKDGTTVASIDLPKLKSYKIALPPAKEQKRIVKKIESLQARSQRAREALAEVGPLLEQFRQSVLAAAFRGDLTADWRAKNPNVEPASVLLDRIRQERRQKWEAAELAKYKAKDKQPPKNWQQKYNNNRLKVRAKAVDSKLSNLYERNLPETWEFVRLKDILILQSGYAFKSKWFVKSGIKLLRGTNIEPGITRWKDVVCLEHEQAQEFSEYLLEKDDIVIAMDRPVISTGLKIARISDEDLPSLLLQRVGRFISEGDVNTDFIYLFLNSFDFLEHIGAQATGTQLPHISANDIESALIPLPPIEEQRQIVNEVFQFLSSIAKVKSDLSESTEYLTQLDQSILSKAFRGQLVPQDPNDEPAAELLARIQAARKNQKLKKPPKKIQKDKVAKKLNNSASQSLRSILDEAGTKMHPDKLRTASGLVSAKFYAKLKEEITSGAIREVIGKDKVRYLVSNK